MKKPTKKAPSAEMGDLNVEVPAALLERLAVYKARNKSKGVTLKSVVEEALDHYLKAKKA